MSDTAVILLGLAGAILALAIGIIGWFVRQMWISHLDDAKAGFKRLEEVEEKTTHLQAVINEFKPSEMTREFARLREKVENAVGWLKRIDERLDRNVPS